ncbi:MAG: lipid A biosynthesis acyltransferase [Pseudomonadota bacterium]
MGENQKTLNIKRPFPSLFSPNLLLPRYWGNWALIGLVGCCVFLPRSWVLILGRGVGRLFFRVNKKRVRIARINLRWCFPHLDHQARERILKTHLTRYGQAIIDLGLIRWGSRKTIDRLCTIEVEAELKDRVQAGEKILLIIPHVVGIDMAGAALARVARGASMMKEPSNPLLHWWLLRGRTRFGARIFMRSQGVRPLVKSIRSGYVGYLMPDEDLGGEYSVFAPFFGIETATLPVVGRLARMTDATVIPMFCILSEEGRYKVVLGDPIEDFPTQNPELDAAKVNLAFQAYIQDAPEQYLWTLKWFRTRPNGESSPYDA